MKLFFSVLFLFTCTFANAEDAAIRQDVESVKQSVLELNTDLYQLEKDLLSPATTRAAFHLSLSHGEYFEPLSIELSVDGESQIQHIYTERQVKALRMGAVQPLGNVNLSPGKHTVRAVVRGVDHLGQGRELIAEDIVEKTSKPLLTELVIQDFVERQSARVQLKYW
ncbi:hypothetical protein [Thalassolituus sp.]|uniref:hypothetical protein n=1 Tax=Thalassolituus sp. TaxID=2030822 RepID=UPI002A83A0B6|nr:hypothetical protein [Thalassolituus sp.]|tara:strand:- start:6 stop:506 length:501 start_codon:yes stop_codon:yes gene_type:complete